MNLMSLDLNLLVALNALLTDQSVGRAAIRIGLSQPAMSHALARLRAIMGDPLLVRVGTRMELTPRAQGLRAPLAQTLDQVRGLFAVDDFDPAESTRRFLLMLPDHIVDLIIPPLAARIADVAPGVHLDALPWRGPDALNPDLARQIDLAIACLPDAYPGFHRQRLYADRDALAVRKDHPEARRLKRLETFLAARHIAVVGRGEREDMIDAWLRPKGIARRIAVTSPSYLHALHMAARTDLVAFLPGRLIEASAKQLGLVQVTPPLDPGLDVQYLFYPTRAQMDPGSLWLRRQFAAVAKPLDREKS